MQMGSAVICILGAMIGAGFASGREIMQFFSGYGMYSWILIGAAAGGMALLMYRVMQRKSRFFDFSCSSSGRLSRGMMLLLLLSTAGGMVAAGGELSALVLPVRYARGMGLLFTATLCTLLSQKSLRILSGFGWILLPLLVFALILCLRLPSLPIRENAPSLGEIFLGFLNILGYAGMNVALAAGVLCDAGEKCQQRGACRCAMWCGFFIWGLLMLYNRALLPYGEILKDQPLPMVALLRIYGKAGYYLSATVLYLAVVTTLIAVLRAAVKILNERLARHGAVLCWLVAILIGICGFERIVAIAYPALGFVCFGMLLWPRKKKPEKTSAFSGKNYSPLNIS